MNRLFSIPRRSYVFTPLRFVINSKRLLALTLRTKNPFQHLFRFKRLNPLQSLQTLRYLTLARISKVFRSFSNRKTNLYISIIIPGCFIIVLKSCNTTQCLPYKKPSRIDEEFSDEKSASFNWKLFLAFLYPDMLCLFLAIIGSILVAILNTYLPIVTGTVLDEVMRMNLADQANFREILPDILRKAAKISLIYGLQGGLTFLSISALTVMGERMSHRLRNDLFKALIEQDIAFFDTHKTSELVSRFSSDVQDLKSGFKLLIGQGLKNTIQTVGCALSIFFLSKQLSFTITGSVAVMVVLGSMFGALLRKWSRSAQAKLSNTLALADESLGNIRTVRSLGREQLEEEKLKNELDDLSYLNTRLGLGIASFQGLSSVIINSLFIVVLAHGGAMVAGNQFSAGNMLAVMVSTQTLQRSLGSLSILFGQVIRGWTGGSRVFEYLTNTPKIPIGGGLKLEDKELKGNIEFRDVLFSYPTREDQDILNEFNLILEAGRVTALWGPSGAGKSTIAALLERFYDPQKGAIYLDGVDVRDLDATWLRGDVLGVISQEPVLFATTVKENIKYGKIDATDEEVIEASNFANAHDFISSFPDGYDTLLGERGLLISAGQKQRIAIARAFLRNPKILILDEATSALDPASERLVQDALNKLVKQRTVLVISHRESIVKHAHKIVLLSHGRVLKEGTYDQIYKEMHQQDIKDKIN